MLQLAKPTPAQEREYRRGSAAEQVFRQESEDFPAQAVSWIKSPKIRWEGPAQIPLSEIDFGNKKKWRASGHPQKVAKFKRMIKAGDRKPVVLVKAPGQRKYKVTDGHHRALAYLELGWDVRAYVGHVPSITGPWDKMHAMQRASQPKKLNLAVAQRQPQKRQQPRPGRGPKPVATPAQLAQIAAVLAGGTVTAASLATAASGIIPGLAWGPLVAAATLLLRWPEPPRQGLGPGTKAAVLENELRRASFLVAAYRRLDTASKAEGGKPGAVADEISNELRYLGQHITASKEREVAGSLIDSASQSYGELLGWYASPGPHVTPECEAANGKNFYAGKPPLIGYPGFVHANCRCAPGKPHPDGAILLTAGIPWRELELAGTPSVPFNPGEHPHGYHGHFAETGNMMGGVETPGQEAWEQAGMKNLMTWAQDKVADAYPGASAGVHVMTTPRGTEFHKIKTPTGYKWLGKAANGDILKTETRKQLHQAAHVHETSHNTPKTGLGEVKHGIPYLIKKVPKPEVPAPGEPTSQVVKPIHQVNDKVIAPNGKHGTVTGIKPYATVPGHSITVTHDDGTKSAGSELAYKAAPNGPVVPVIGDKVAGISADGAHVAGTVKAVGALASGKPYAMIIDAKGKQYTVSDMKKLPPGTPLEKMPAPVTGDLLSQAHDMQGEIITKGTHVMVGPKLVGLAPSGEVTGITVAANGKPYVKWVGSDGKPHSAFADELLVTGTPLPGKPISPAPAAIPGPFNTGDKVKDTHTGNSGTVMSVSAGSSPGKQYVTYVDAKGDYHNSYAETLVGDNKKPDSYWMDLYEKGLLTAQEYQEETGKWPSDQAEALSTGTGSPLKGKISAMDAGVPVSVYNQAVAKANVKGEAWLKKSEDGGWFASSVKPTLSIAKEHFKVLPGGETIHVPAGTGRVEQPAAANPLSAAQQTEVMLKAGVPKLLIDNAKKLANQSGSAKFLKQKTAGGWGISASPITPGWEAFKVHPDGSITHMPGEKKSANAGNPEIGAWKNHYDLKELPLTGVWETKTYKARYEVRAAKGVNKGKKVAILSENKAGQWSISDVHGHVYGTGLQSQDQAMNRMFHYYKPAAWQKLHGSQTPEQVSGHTVSEAIGGMTSAPKAPSAAAQTSGAKLEKDVTAAVASVKNSHAFLDVVNYVKVNGLKKEFWVATPDNGKTWVKLDENPKFTPGHPFNGKENFWINTKNEVTHWAPGMSVAEVDNGLTKIVLDANKPHLDKIAFEKQQASLLADKKLKEALGKIPDQVATDYTGTQAHYKANAALKLTHEEITAIHSYQGSGYSVINNALRKQQEPGFDPSKISQSTKNKIKLIDSAMKKWQLPHDITISRKIQHAGWLPSESIVGQAVTEHGFSSTSFSSGVWSGNVRMWIRVPKGFNAIHMNGIAGSVHPGEKELLLPRGTRYVIVEDVVIHGVRTLVMEALNPEGVIMLAREEWDPERLLKYAWDAKSWRLRPATSDELETAVRRLK